MLQAFASCGNTQLGNQNRRCAASSRRHRSGAVTVELLTSLQQDARECEYTGSVDKLLQPLAYSCNPARDTAVIAYDDVIALGVISRPRERDVRVDQDMNVIGVDDGRTLAAIASPPLTTVRVPGARPVPTPAVRAWISPSDEMPVALPPPGSAPPI